MSWILIPQSGVEAIKVDEFRDIKLRVKVNGSAAVSFPKGKHGEKVFNEFMLELWPPKLGFDKIFLLMAFNKFTEECVVKIIIIINIKQIMKI